MESTPHLEKAYRIFIEWKSRPVSHTAPQNVLEFCDRYKISSAELMSFTQRPTFQDDLLKSTIEWAKQSIPDILHVLYEEIFASKNPSDIEKFVDIIQSLSRKDKDGGIQNTFNFFGNINDQRYRDIIKRETELLDSSIAAEIA